MVQFHHRILFLLTAVLPLCASAQPDKRWTLQPDSTVVVHFEDVKRWATNRVAQNLATHSAVLEIGALNGQVQTLRTIADTERQSKEAMRAAWEGCEAERADLMVDRDRWKGKAQRRNRNTLIFTLAGVALGVILAR
jgi:hypothetical protein